MAKQAITVMLILLLLTNGNISRTVTRKSAAIIAEIILDANPRKTTTKNIILPSRLADCISKDNKENELFY